MASTVAFVLISSMLLLVLHHKNPYANEKSNHQQYGCDTSDDHSVHIHSLYSCSI